jgi:hypothetical protein
VLEKSTRVFCCLAQNYVSNTIQSQIPIVATLPSSVTQLIVAKLAMSAGLSMKVIVLILLFL